MVVVGESPAGGSTGVFLARAHLDAKVLVDSVGGETLLDAIDDETIAAHLGHQND